MRPPSISPAVVVGISTHNRAEILPKAIRSALAQSHPRIRVAVIDDASTDQTPGVRRLFPQVDWTRWDQNRGFVAARNQLMLGSGEDYFVSLDDDAWFIEGDEIALAVAYLESHADVAAIAFDILSPDRPRPAPREGEHPVPMFIGCGHVLRLAAVREMRGYESYPGSYGGEEKDFCLRLLDAGYRIVMLRGVHVWHDKTEVARDRPRQYRSSVCNDLALAVRRTPAAALPFAVAWKLARHLQFSVRTGLVKPYLQGVAAFGCAIRAVWSARRPVRLRTLRAFGRLARGKTV